MSECLSSSSKRDKLANNSYNKTIPVFSSRLKQNKPKDLCLTSSNIK